MRVIFCFLVMLAVIFVAPLLAPEPPPQPLHQLQNQIDTLLEPLEGH